MALQKQPISINFSQGVQTKIDPFQLLIGQFQSLGNTVFNKDGLQEKRNGFGFLVNAPTAAQTLCTLNSGLVALGQTCQSYSAESGQLTNAGTFQPMKLSTAPMVRRATSQTTCDVEVADNGLACSTWLDEDGNSYYQISDSVTGQIVIPAVQLPSTATMSRVEAVTSYFIITFLATVSAASHLQYIAIPIGNPANPTSPVDIASNAVSLSAPYDITTYGDNLVIAVTCSDSKIRVYSATGPELVAGNIPTPAAVVIDENPVTILSTAVDTSNVSFPIIWVTYYGTSGGGVAIDVFALNSDLTVNLATTSLNFIAPLTLATAASDGILTIIAENTDNYKRYSGDINIGGGATTNILVSTTVDLSGSQGASPTIANGVGLASKAIFSTALQELVFLAVNRQTLQPTYYLMDTNGNVLARLAYSNGFGTITNQIMPQINENTNNDLLVGYLFADLLLAATKDTSSTNNSPVYSQYGINLATFVLNGQTSALEIAGSLHASGGMLWQYDGVKIREHGFNVFPEDLAVVGAGTGSITTSDSPLFYVATYEWTDAAGQLHRSAPSVPLEYTITTPPANFTANRTSGSNLFTSVSSFTGLQVGQPVSGTGIAPGSYITILTPGSNTLRLSLGATSGTNTSTTITPSAVSAITITVPTLRQTYKTDNLVRIVIYRWSTSQPNYFRVTSITSPVLNDPTVQQVHFTDTQSDAQIEGNDILYTTGGVIENICAPGAVAMTLWQSRLFLVDAEDPNLIWFSKQVIEATPVEMSDALTLFVAPTTGAQGSTGPITALSAMDDKLIVFKRDAIYYITGQGPDNTGANNSFSDPVFISSTVGCVNPQSIVLMPQGIMFQSDKGIWMLGRDLQTTYIGAPVETYTQGQLVTSALCIPATNQVRFTMANRTAVMYDYFFNRWSNWSNINAISSVVYNQVQTYLNTFNQIVIETPGQYLDISTPVLLSFTTGWINLAGLQGFERFYQLFLLGVYKSPFKLNVQLAYDYNSSPQQSTIVTPEQAPSSWGSEAAWGTGGPWGGGANVFEARIFPSIQKCEAFQVTVNEIFVPATAMGAGAGLTLSGMNLIVGVKRGYRTQAASRSFGK